jgi:YVTN family beta-propeller protein
MQLRTTIEVVRSRWPILIALVFWPIAALLRGAAFDALPGMPKVVDPNDIYSEAHAGKLSPAVKNFPDLIYVPNTGSNSVDVIDPRTYRVVDRFKVRRQPQHVTPSYDLKTLWILCDLGDNLTKIDPATGKIGETVRVKDPYNMYYTPDGKFAIVVAERVHRLDFRNPSTMDLVDSVAVPCRGVDHMDFSADGRYLIASCEFSRTSRNRAGIEPAMRSPVPAAPAAPNVRRHREDGIRPYACRRYCASCPPHPAFDRRPNRFSPR